MVSATLKLTSTACRNVPKPSFWALSSRAPFSTSLAAATTREREAPFAKCTGIFVTSASPVADSFETQVDFSDGSAYLFHNMWLRDSCRDSPHITDVGERQLDASPILNRTEFSIPITGTSIDALGNLVVEWGKGTVPQSSFDAAWLRTYADAAALHIRGKRVEVREGRLDVFDHLQGIGPERGQCRETLSLWKNDGSFEIPRFDYGDISNPLEVMRTVIDPGVAIVQGMPEDVAKDGSVFQQFAADYFTGLQKHPLREEAHWTISTEQSVQIKDTHFSSSANATSNNNSYNTNQQLANHTDQVLYGSPGLLLMFHCAFGQGGNSITDGFAATYAFKDRYPELYQSLCKYGLNLGRRLEYYTKGSMMFNKAEPILKEDADGNLVRIMYNEIYRAPLTLPFEEYEKYYMAYTTWYQMVHSPEFQMSISLSKGETIIFNNWRTMHGRAGLAGKARIIFGGTITRDAFYSQVRHLEQQRCNVPNHLETGMTVNEYTRYAAVTRSNQF